MARPARRDHLVDTALQLFDRHGYHATGIDRILGESGVAKMTLYKYFKSKDELILAALRLRDERLRNWLMREVEQRAATPKDRLFAIFDVVHDFLTSKDFNGCMFIGACAEFADPDDPIHVASAEHKRLFVAYIRRLAAAAGARDPDELAEQLDLLIEGAIVVAQVSGRSDTARQAGRAAKPLILGALAETPPG